MVVLRILLTFWICDWDRDYNQYEENKNDTYDELKSWLEKKKGESLLDLVLISICENEESSMVCFWSNVFYDNNSLDKEYTDLLLWIGVTELS